MDVCHSERSNEEISVEPADPLFESLIKRKPYRTISIQFMVSSDVGIQIKFMLDWPRNSVLLG